MARLLQIFKTGNIIDKTFIIIVPFVLLFGLSDFIAYYNNSPDDYTNISNELNVDKNNNQENINDKPEIIVDKQPTIYFNKSITGRGSSDEGRSEPQYTGLYGYAAVYDGLDVRNLSFTESWTIPTYKKIDFDHYEINGEIDHKSIIKVKSQNLTHRGYGVYVGYLTVSTLDNEDVEYIINANNFITNDYWNLNSVYDSTNYGYTIAEYNQISDKLPVFINNDIVQLEDGLRVIVKGKTGLYPGDNVDNSLRQIEAYYLDKNGMDRTVFFNENDLKIIY